jgi:hypothetical protein
VCAYVNVCVRACERVCVCVCTLARAYARVCTRVCVQSEIDRLHADAHGNAEFRRQAAEKEAQLGALRAEADRMAEEIARLNDQACPYVMRIPLATQSSLAGGSSVGSNRRCEPGGDGHAAAADNARLCSAGLGLRLHALRAEVVPR